MQFKEIGYFSKTHGLKGHLLLFTSVDLEIEQIKAVFIEIGGSQAPYFVEEIKPFTNGFLVKLESVNSVEEANKLKNKTIFADKKLVYEEEEFEFLNFTLFDLEKGEIGLIEEFIDTPGNPILKIMKGDKEILLPFSEDFIEAVKKKEKQLIYRAPEGLLEIYL